MSGTPQDGVKKSGAVGEKLGQHAILYYTVR